EASFFAGNMPDVFCGGYGVFLFVAPDMEGVSEHNITHQAAWIIVTEIERWIELEIPCDVASETDGRRVFRAALPINLHSPSFIEVVSVPEDCFVFVSGMNGSDDHLVMLGVVASFDIRL